eukprot:4270705-Prymnesium_polylepis.2
MASLAAEHTAQHSEPTSRAPAGLAAHAGESKRSAAVQAKRSAADLAFFNPHVVRTGATRSTTASPSLTSTRAKMATWTLPA